MKLYKITGPNGEPIHGGSGKWALPTTTKPGKWMPRIENVHVCHAGYHLIPAIAIVEWLPRASQTGVLWEAEGRWLRARIEARKAAEPIDLGDTETGR